MRDVEAYLREKGLAFKVADRARSGKQAIMNCPFCDDNEQKFAVNLETGAFKCFHENRCGRQGSFKDLQREFGDEPDAPLYAGERRSERPNYERPKVKAQKPEGKVEAYLKSRGLTAETIKRFRIATSEKGAIMFPYFKHGELVGVKYRSVGEEKKRMWQEPNAEPVLYGRDLIEENTQEIILCEGEIDCMSWDQLGYPVVSVPNGVKDERWIETEWDFINRFQKVFLSFDMDEAGREALLRTARRLGLWRCYRVELPRKDANEVLQHEDDPGGALGESIFSAKGFTLPEIVDPGSQAESVVELYEDPKKLHGWSTGFDKVDFHLKGWRPKEVTIWTGANGSGKTTLLNQMMVDFTFKHEQPVFIASMEMAVPQMLYLISKSYVQVESAENVRRFLSQLNGRVYLLDRNEEIDEDTLLNTMEFAAKKYGVRMFVVDSLMRVTLKLRGHEELEGQKQFTDRLVNFAKIYDSHVHLVAHPRKGMSDDHIPGKVDVSGAGDITNLTANVVAVWRPSGDKLKKIRQKTGYADFTNAFIILKNRLFGDVGWVYLTYDKGRRALKQAQRGKGAEETEPDEGSRDEDDQG